MTRQIFPALQGFRIKRPPGYILNLHSLQTHEKSKQIARAAKKINRFKRISIVKNYITTLLIRLAVALPAFFTFPRKESFTFNSFTALTSAEPTPSLSMSIV